MKCYYLTDDSEKSLAPFFSKMVLSASFISVVIISVILLIFWPRQPLAGFIIVNKTPLAFFLIFAATLIIYSYLNLCCGSGDMIQRGYYIIKFRTAKSTFEKEIDFFRYGLIEFLLHTMVLLLPFLPLLILAASISAVSLITFVQAVFILYTASLLCRMFGFMVYLFWGRLSTIGYFTARAFMIVFIFGTFIFAPLINPLQFLYLLNESPNAMGLPFVLYMAVVMFATLLLILANHTLVRRRMNQEKTT
jgi:hypothetical protein